MSDLIKRIKEEPMQTGWKPHPVGTFKNSVCVEVKEKEFNGNLLYEIHFKTSAGIAKASIWRRTESDIAVISAKTGKSMKEAEDMYVGAMQRMMRLYTDLGLSEPDAADLKEFEYQCYGRLGELIGRVADIEVKAGKDAKNPTVYINAPTGGKIKNEAVDTPASSESGPMDIESIPF